MSVFGNIEHDAEEFGEKELNQKLGQGGNQGQQQGGGQDQY